jgi:transcriptional regulator with XRE-family HTH domain
MKHPAKSVFGRNFREARKRAGLSQADIERRTGILRSSISDVEKGKQNVTIDTMERLAASVSVDMATLLKDDQTLP